MNVSVDAVVRDVAKRIEAGLGHLTAEMTGMFIEVIPEFRHDDAVRQLMIASTSSNLTAIVDMLALGISLDDITVPPAAAEYARRFAQLDLSLEALLRAYRLGEHMFLQRAVEELQKIEMPARDALSTTSRVALLANSYIDRVIEGLIDIYEDERGRWSARSDAARAASVRAVLETEGLDLTSAEEMLSISLRGWHLAAVIWMLPGASDPGAVTLQAAAGMLAAAAGRAPLLVSADEQTLWAWISSAGKPAVDLERLESDLRTRPAVRVAVGEPSTGLSGFRQTFQEAQRARGVAMAGDAGAVTRYTDVALASLLIDRVPDVRAWAGRVLGDLLRDDENMARLRETVQVFLDTGGSFTDAAARMHVHKNTVHYRVRKAEEVLGHPLSQNRLHIEVALLACAQLGLVGRS
ncbi:PucR family transcriptional regulator [Amycolatopsis thermoflava]